MKRLAILVLSAAALASAADLSGVHNVYLLQMSKGFDQYLANRLTADKVFQVVTDPKLADAIFTDQIGENFQSKMDELFPPPEPEKPAKPAKDEKDAKDAKDGKKAKDEDSDDSTSGLFTDTVNKLSAPISSFGRAKGMVFIVDAKSKQVLWSVYALPKDSSSKELDHTASAVVSRLKRDLGMK